MARENGLPARRPAAEGEGAEARARARERTLSEDARLVAAVRAGEASAAAAFYDRVQPTVARAVGRLLGRHDADAEDLVQLALIELVTSIDRYRGEGTLDAWAATVAAHVVYKHIRRRRTERRIFAPEPEEALPASTSRAGRDAVMRSVMRRVREHLDAIEPNKAWTFLLHDVCGYDLREIASITGATVAAAQTRLIRGRREVHERIAKDPDLAGLLDDLEGTP